MSIPDFAETSGSPQPAPAAHLQTLSRGIRPLEILPKTDEPMSIVELAAALDVHRSIAYRILRTLDDHGLHSPGHPIRA